MSKSVLANTDGNHALIILAGAPATNAWRAAHPGKPLLATGLNCSNLDLSGINLSESILNGARFENCNLAYANFSRASLRSVQFKNCDLTGVRFDEAHVTNVYLDMVNLDKANFGSCATLSRLKHLSLRQLPIVEPSYDPNKVLWIDRWFPWSRLRFLATIRIFIPAYASLILSVLYLNCLFLYNRSITAMNEIMIAAIGDYHNFLPFEPVKPSWTHLAILLAFFLLAAASTAFLACPGRIIDFTLERWISEAKQPRLLYDHAAWSRPGLRLLCAITLSAGGAISLALIICAITQQVTLILSSII